MPRRREPTGDAPVESGAAEAPAPASEAPVPAAGNILTVRRVQPVHGPGKPLLKAAEFLDQCRELLGLSDEAPAAQVQADVLAVLRLSHAETPRRWPT